MTSVKRTGFKCLSNVKSFFPQADQQNVIISEEKLTKNCLRSLFWFLKPTFLSLASLRKIESRKAAAPWEDSEDTFHRTFTAEIVVVARNPITKLLPVLFDIMSFSSKFRAVG